MVLKTRTLTEQMGQILAAQGDAGQRVATILKNIGEDVFEGERAAAFVSDARKNRRLDAVGAGSVGGGSVECHLFFPTAGRALLADAPSDTLT